VDTGCITGVKKMSGNAMLRTTFGSMREERRGE